MPAAAQTQITNRRGRTNRPTLWGPGKSGNPGGRPKALTTVRDMARADTPALMKELLRLALYAESENVRLNAIREALDRGWGKAITPIQVSPGTPGTAIVAAVVGELPEIEGDLVVGDDGVYRIEAADGPVEPSDKS
jgi:hypothetical protein